MPLTPIQERTFQFSTRVLEFVRMISQNQIIDPLVRQVVRSSTSIGANIAEGHNAASKREFLKYYQIALRSSRETEYWLGLIEEG